MYLEFNISHLLISYYIIYLLYGKVLNLNYMKMFNSIRQNFLFNSVTQTFLIVYFNFNLTLVISFKIGVTVN